MSSPNQTPSMLKGTFVQMKGLGRKTHFNAPNRTPIDLSWLMLAPVTYSDLLVYLTTTSIWGELINIGGIPGRGVRTRTPDSSDDVEGSLSIRKIPRVFYVFLPKFLYRQQVFQGMYPIAIVLSTFYLA